MIDSKCEATTGGTIHLVSESHNRTLAYMHAAHTFIAALQQVILEAFMNAVNLIRLTE